MLSIAAIVASLLSGPAITPPSAVTTIEFSEPSASPMLGPNGEFDWCPPEDADTIWEHAMGEDSEENMAVIAGAKLLRVKLGAAVLVHPAGKPTEEGDKGVQVRLAYQVVRDGTKGLVTVEGGYCAPSTAAYRLKQADAR